MNMDEIPTDVYPREELEVPEGYCEGDEEMVNLQTNHGAIRPYRTFDNHIKFWSECVCCLTEDV